jgi:hypothetical protein
MKNAGTLFNRGVLGLTSLLLVALLLGTSGCSYIKAKITPSGSDSTTWHSREQYVKIIKQDAEKGGVITPNDHPIVLDAGQIRNALASLEVRLDVNEKIIAVFTKEELDVLCGKLSEALMKAGPNDDVTFVVVGHRKAVYGLATQRKATSGRVFYREGKLNIIFGKVVADMGEHTDYRLAPLSPGSRTRPVSHKWVLEEQPDAKFYAAGGMLRGDWLVMDLANMAAYDAMGTRPGKSGKDAVEDAAQGKGPIFYENRQDAASRPAKTMEERMKTLNDLKEKKLITEEEYKAKKASLLNEL